MTNPKLRDQLIIAAFNAAEDVDAPHGGPMPAGDAIAKMQLGKFADAALAVFTQYLQDEDARAQLYLEYFNYEDWQIGDDDKLRLGDFIYLNHQRAHDGHEEDMTGQIVRHYLNDLPVILVNRELHEDGEVSGNYVDLQDLFIWGWTFTRIPEKDADLIKPPALNSIGGE